MRAAPEPIKVGKVGLTDGKDWTGGAAWADAAAEEVQRIGQAG